MNLELRSAGKVFVTESAAYWTGIVISKTYEGSGEVWSGVLVLRHVAYYGFDKFSQIWCACSL